MLSTLALVFVKRWGGIGVKYTGSDIPLNTVLNTRAPVQCLRGVG